MQCAAAPPASGGASDLSAMNPQHPLRAASCSAASCSCVAEVSETARCGVFVAAYPSALNCGGCTLGIQHEALRRRLLARRSLIRRRAALLSPCVHLRHACFSAARFQSRNYAARALPQEHDQPLKPAKRISLPLSSLL